MTHNEKQTATTQGDEWCKAKKIVTTQGEKQTTTNIRQRTSNNKSKVKQASTKAKQ